MIEKLRSWWNSRKQKNRVESYYRNQKKRISRGESLSISEVIDVLSQDGGPLEVENVSIPGDDGTRAQELKSRVQNEINRHRKD